MPNDLAAYTAGAPNLQAYADHGDGTVTDSVTGLMWQQTIPPTQYTLDGARAYCSSLALGGHSDWRVPSFIELISLVDYRSISASSTVAAIDGIAFPSTPADVFISSTTFGPASQGAFSTVSFGNGQLYHAAGSSSSSSSYLRCVR